MLKLMIVDDQYAARQAIRQALDFDKLGFELVDDAASGNDALDKIHLFHPDVIISEIKLPDVDGAEFIKTLYEEHFDGKVIILSQCSEFYYVKTAYEHGVFRYILKPFDVAELMLAVVEAGNKRYRELGVAADKTGKPTYKKHVLDALKYISEHFADSKLSIGEVAEHLKVSESYLMHTLKSNLGKTFTACLAEFRVMKAKSLLLIGRNRINEIAEMVGFVDVKYFSQVFKKYEGVTPSEYVKKNG